MALAAVVLVVCCAGPVLAGGAVLAGVTGFVAGAWWLFALAGMLFVLALIGLHRRAGSAGGKR
jgi:hypothetical protein